MFRAIKRARGFTFLGNSKVMMHDIPDSDHTFSRPEWRKELFDHTISWIRNLTKPGDR